jgi:CRP/FNR family transcriptional regulator
MSRPEPGQLLRAYPALRQASAASQARIEAQCVRIQVAAGRPLFGEGSPATAYPLLLEGVVRVSKPSPDGREVLLYRLRPGECCLITAAALLGETTFPAAGSAETEVLAYGLPRQVFTGLLLESPGFRAFVFGALSRRMAQLMGLVDELVFRRIDQRLASLLLLHREAIAATHQQLADDLGTSREVISRILGSFQQAGMIRLGRKRIEILDRSALGRLEARPVEAAS